MKARDQMRVIEERQRLLAIEADLQRATLAATFEKWEQRKLLAFGSTLASWGWKLLAVPRIRWLVAGTLLSRFKARRRHA